MKLSVVYQRPPRLSDMIGEGEGDFQSSCRWYTSDYFVSVGTTTLGLMWFPTLITELVSHYCYHHYHYRNQPLPLALLTLPQPLLLHNYSIITQYFCITTAAAIATNTDLLVLPLLPLLLSDNGNDKPHFLLLFGGGFFLACENLGERFDDSLPTCFFLLFCSDFFF